MGMAQVIGISQRNRLGIGETSAGVLIEPSASFDIVLVGIWRGSAGAAMTKRRTAQTLKKIVRCAVLLKYYDHVLKRVGIRNNARLLGLANIGAKETDCYQKCRRAAEASHTFSNLQNR